MHVCIPVYHLHQAKGCEVYDLHFDFFLLLYIHYLFLSFSTQTLQYKSCYCTNLNENIKNVPSYTQVLGEDLELPFAGASKSVRDLFRLPPENFTARGIKDPSSVIFILSLSIDSCAFSLLDKVTNPEDFD